MAELHIVGQVVGATGFDGHSIFCKVRALLGVQLATGASMSRPPPAAAPLLLHHRLLRLVPETQAAAASGPTLHPPNTHTSSRTHDTQSGACMQAGAGS